MKLETIEEMNQFIRDNADDFHPFACFDKHLDCIRVQIKDCSVKENRLSRFFTILQENHTVSIHYVGFSIKGIRHLFERIGFPATETTTLKLTSIIDAIVQVYPDDAVRTIQDAFTEVLDEHELEVKVDLAPAA